LFGAYAGRAPEVWATAEPGLGRDLKELLHRALRARLKAQHGEIADQLAVGMAAEVLHPVTSTAKTTLEVGHFSGDVEIAWKELTIHAPVSIELRWNTNAAGAERGVWQILASGQSVPLAWGYATAAPGGIFSINLGKYLPSSPPNAPAV